LKTRTEADYLSEFDCGLVRLHIVSVCDSLGVGVSDAVPNDLPFGRNNLPVPAVAILHNTLLKMV
jgi:hypothetical protein